MPVKTKNGKWRWGNIERGSKKELAQTVYGVWKKNGGKGDFGKFFKTGKMNEDEHAAWTGKTFVKSVFIQAVGSFMDAFGVDLSHMDIVVSPVPHFSDGRPSRMPVDEYAGSWLYGSRIEICPDMSVPMRTFGVDDMAPDKFTAWIIAHELAHEIWHMMPAARALVERAAADARAAGFSTKYLETVAPEKYEQELFCEYAASIVSSMVFSGTTAFMMVPKRHIMDLLGEMTEYSGNLRFDGSQFEPYLESEKKIDQDSIYYGAFVDGRCTALSYLNRVPPGFVLIAYVSSAVSGGGESLIRNVMSRSRGIWWAADPDGGDLLLTYYRRFGLKEHVIRRSKWVQGRRETVFYRAPDEESRSVLAKMLKNAELGA